MKPKPLPQLSIFAAAVFLLTAASPCHAQVPNRLNYQGRVSVQGVNHAGPGLFKFALVGPEENISSQATAVPVIGGLGDGMGPRVLSISMLNGGSGYTTVPAVTITHPTGSGAAATAVLTDGVVTSIEVTENGLGYEGPNTDTVVTIDAPPVNLQRPTRWSNDGTSIMGSEPAQAVELPVLGGLYSVALGNTDLPNMNMLQENLFARHSELYLRVWFDDGTHGFQLLSPDQRLLSAPYAMFAATVPDGSISSIKIAEGAVGPNQLAPGAVGSDQLASGVITPAAFNTGGTPPEAGQVLSYLNGSLHWVAGGGMSLPHAEDLAHAGPLLDLTNNGDGPAITGEALFNDGLKGITSMSGVSGVVGVNNAPPPFGNAPRGQGVFGYGSDAAVGVLGVSEGNDGVSARTNAPNKSGLFGYSAATNSAGVHGNSVNGDGVVGYSGHTGHSGGYFAHTAGGNALKTSGKAEINGWLTVNDTDLWLGHASRRGTPGRAVVDWKQNSGAPTQLYLNFGDDWEETKIGGAVTEVKTLRITGGADLAEPFAMSHENIEPGSVVIIDELNPGKLRMSSVAYDKKVAGIVSGADGINPGISMIQENMLEAGKNVALSGRVYVKANDSAGEIQPGDFVTTSAIPGEAMKASDHDRAQGAIIGKAMTRLSDGNGKVLVLVTLQ